MINSKFYEILTNTTAIGNTVRLQVINHNVIYVRLSIRTNNLLSMTMFSNLAHFLLNFESLHNNRSQLVTGVKSFIAK
ncbi:hypothetical protein TKO01_20650 [Tetragenococcus koreensis]|nr:hypothetical protein TKO01_20650 [Tetragenococcus koreensis]